MSLRQSHFVPPVPYLIAAHHGMLDGLDVDTTRATSSASQLEGLISGELDLAVTAIDNLFEWTKAGADLRLVAQVEKTTPLGLYARDSAESLADLAGRRFAVDALSNGFALAARRVLQDAGVEVHYVEVGGVRERFDALVAGDADATLLGPPIDELAVAAGMRCLAAVNSLLPDFPGQGLVVRAPLVGSEELHDYLRALVRRRGVLPLAFGRRRRRLPDAMRLLHGGQRRRGKPGRRPWKSAPQASPCSRTSGGALACCHRVSNSPRSAMLARCAGPPKPSSDKPRHCETCPDRKTCAQQTPLRSEPL